MATSMTMKQRFGIFQPVFYGDEDEAAIRYLLGQNSPCSLATDTRQFGILIERALTSAFQNRKSDFANIHDGDWTKTN